MWCIYEFRWLRRPDSSEAEVTGPRRTLGTAFKSFAWDQCIPSVTGPSSQPQKSLCVHVSAFLPVLLWLIYSWFWWDWTMWLLSLFLFYKVKFFFFLLKFHVCFSMLFSEWNCQILKKKYCWDLRFLVWLHWIYRSDRRELRKTKLPSCLMEHKSKIVSNTRHIEYKDNKYVESLGKH